MNTLNIIYLNHYKPSLMNNKTFTNFINISILFVLTVFSSNAQTINVGISTPLTNSELNGEAITEFRATISASNDSLLVNPQVIWESSINGFLSNKLVFTAGNILSNGVHWIKVTVKKGNTMDKDSAIINVFGSVPTIFTQEMPIGQVGINYTKSIYGKSSGLRFTYAVESGALPDGLAITTNTGEIKGMPTTAGNFNFSIKVNNANGSEVKKLSIYIAPQGQYNGMVREYYTSISGGIEGLVTNAKYPSSPAAVELISGSETGNYWSNNYGSRFSGYIIAPTTGIYKFALASDDQGELYLSTDCKSANKVKIATCTTSVKKNIFTATPEQVSAAISLQAGKVYYIEALHVDGSFEDFIQIAWIKPGTTDTTNIAAKNLLSSYNGTDCLAPILLDDVTPPSIPMNLTLVKAGASFLSVAWEASTDNKSVKGYEVMVDGKFVGMVMGAANSNYVATGLMPNTNYKISVKAVDLDGNKSVSSSDLTAKTSITDNVAPATVINLLVKSTTETTATITFDKTTDNIGVVKYIIYSNDVAIGETVSTANNLEFTISKLATNTSYNIKVVAADAAENMSVASSVVIAKTKVDVTAPTAPLGLVEFFIEETEISLLWDASTDNVGVVGYELYIDNQLNPGIKTETSFTASKLLPGTNYTFKVLAIDAAGNKSPFSAALTLKTMGTNGTEDSRNTLHSINIFPNPSNHLVYIKGLKENIPVTITIQNQLGSTVQVSDGATVNIESLVEGSYFMVIEQDNKRAIKHFLKK